MRLLQEALFFCVYDEPSVDLCLHKDLHLANEMLYGVYRSSRSQPARLYDEPSADLCLHKDLYLANVHHRAAK